MKKSVRNVDINGRPGSKNLNNVQTAKGILGMAVGL